MLPRMRLRHGLLSASAAVLVVLAADPAYADSVRDKQWHLGFLRIAEAQKISQGAGITVAVIDSGVADHQDLAGNVLDGADAIAGGAGNGRGDDDGHGTGMAGLIAAHGHGSGGRDGALGIAPQAKILPLRITIGKVQGLDKPMAEAIRWSMQHGAKIINISQDIGDIETLRVMTEAQKAGVLIFAAAGNTDASDTAVSAPAGFPWAVAVAGVGRDGLHAPTSVTGPEVELAAPAVDITSTSKGSAWRTGTGTSDSTAIASGVAALVWSRYPTLTAAEVLHRMEATAVDKGAPGRDPEYGFGVIDPVAALTADVPPLVSPTPSLRSRSPLPSPASPPAVAEQSTSDGGGGSDVVLVAASVAAGLVVLLVVVAVLVRRSRRQPPPGSPGWPQPPGPPGWPPPPGPQPPSGPPEWRSPEWPPASG